MSTYGMSPFRIALAYASAGFAAYLGYTRPARSMWWYGLAAFLAVIAVVRTVRYLNAKAAPPSDTQDQL